MRVYIISSVMHVFRLVLTYDLLEDRRIDDVIIKIFFNSLLFKTNRFQVAVRLFIDYRGRQNMVRTSVTHSAAPRVPLFCLFLPHFDVICDLLHEQTNGNLESLC